MIFGVECYVYHHVIILEPPQIPAQEIAGVWVILRDRRHMRSFLKEGEFPLSLER